MENVQNDQNVMGQRASLLLRRLGVLIEAVFIKVVCGEMRGLFGMSGACSVRIAGFLKI